MTVAATAKMMTTATVAARIIGDALHRPRVSSWGKLPPWFSPRLIARSIGRVTRGRSTFSRASSRVE